MARIIKIHHVAMVVNDIDTSLEFWRDGLGLTLEQIQHIPEQDSKIAFLPIGAGEIELVQPIGKDSGLARYLEKRGPGLHHICIQVDEIKSLITDLKQKGFRLINEEPIQGEDGKTICFHPPGINWWSSC